MKKFVQGFKEQILIIPLHLEVGQLIPQSTNLNNFTRVLPQIMNRDCTFQDK